MSPWILHAALLVSRKRPLASSILHSLVGAGSALAGDLRPVPVAHLFKFLANEELEHKNELEKLYYEIVHNGGV